MKYVLALDQGTTSSRAILFDEDGAARAISQREIRQIYPQPGWVEHDPLEILLTQRETAREVLETGGVHAREVVCVGITNQRETTILWDRQSGNPVANAIVWQDRRTAARCAELRASGAGTLVRERTGLLLDPYFSATKLAWLLDHIPGARGRAERGELAFGTVDTWLVWHLTGNRTHVTDVSNASRTLLYDIHRGDWSGELLELFRVPRAILPDVHASSAAFGMVPADLLGEAVPITGIAGDQQAALFGQACLRPGMAKNTYGTGCFLLLNTGADAVRSEKGLITTLCAQGGSDAAPAFALEGSVFVGGAVVQWLRDELGIIRSAAEVETLASRVTDSGGVFLVPAFTGLGAPYWDPHARGAIIGLTRGTGKAHIARAAIEAIAYQSAELLLAMRDDFGKPIAELRVDGGAAANDLLLQFQADLLGIPVVRPRGLETTARGAAFLAGLAAGVWNGAAAIAERWREDQRFEPRMDPDAAVEHLGRWRAAVERARNWAE